MTLTTTHDPLTTSQYITLEITSRDMLYSSRSLREKLEHTMNNLQNIVEEFNHPYIPPAVLDRDSAPSDPVVPDEWI